MPRASAVIVLAAIVPFCALLLVSCARRSPSELAVVSVGAPALVQNALLYVAEASRLYETAGVTVTIKDFRTGPGAIAALMSRTVDVAETAEFPFVESVMKGERLRILATNDVFENDYLVVRKDRRITTPADLEGKRIGVALGTVTQFYLGRYLTLNGLSPRKVIEVDVPPSGFLRSILGGKVDAIVAWRSYVRRMIAARPGAFEVWPVQSSQPVFGILICRSRWIQGHSKEAEAFLKALAMARAFLEAHPRESKAIVSRRLGDDLSEVSHVWSDHEFSLTLDYSLVAAMQQEARWLIARRLSEAGTIPDLERYIYSEALSAVRPDGVSLMR